MDFLNSLFDSTFFSLFLAIAIGTGLGAIRLWGVSLGAAGVFFVALVFGHFGRSTPAALTELGLLLFVYAVGLNAGPRFLSILRLRGKQFLLVGLASTVAGALATIGLAYAFGLTPELAAGMYSGATTCTPALAAAIDAAQRFLPEPVQIVSVGYGVAYPFSVIGVVIFIQLLPRILRTTPQAAAQRARLDEGPGAELESCAFRVTNPNCVGRTIDEIQKLHISEAVISRIKHAGVVGPVRPESTLYLGDVVLAVGKPEEIAKLETLIGDVVVEPMQDPTGNLTSQDVVVSRREVEGRTYRELAVWERYGVTITRVRRSHIEFSPSGNVALEPGDVLRAVGPRDQVAAFAKAVGREDRRLDETSLLPYAAGIAIGAAVGLIPIPLPGGIRTQLGLGGGAFVVALLLGHLGHIGPFRVYVPNAAHYLARELGLVIFLAGAGMSAGQKFLPVLQQAGPQLLIAGAIVTIITAGTAMLVLAWVLRWNMLSAAGAICACMTNPPGLNAATRLASNSDAAAVGFASVYPVALLAKIILAQLIYLLLRL